MKRVLFWLVFPPSALISILLVILGKVAMVLGEWLINKVDEFEKWTS